MNIFINWSKREYPPAVKALILALAGAIFPLLIPFLLIKSIPNCEERIGLVVFHPGLYTLIPGLILVICGMFFALWSIGMQIFKADGTPVPIIPTRRLLTSGPFKYCRNPMTFGTICAYTGIGIAVSSVMDIIFVTIFALGLILYIKRIEEKELAARFGQPYLNYKKDTPFIIPRILDKR